jgi:N-acetylglucosamine-6-phosphate deacetylase
MNPYNIYTIILFLVRTLNRQYDIQSFVPVNLKIGKQTCTFDPLIRENNHVINSRSLTETTDKKKKKMKNIYFSVFVLLLSIAAKSQTTKIVALHYETCKPVVVEISGDQISRINSSRDMPQTQWFVAPGLIDLQINGYMGVDFSDQNLTPEAFQKATEALWKQGVTTFLPTVITASKENLEKSFSLLSEAISNPEIAVSVPGFHMEGPYISPVKGFRGAHLEKYIRKPDWNEFLALQNAAGNKIKLVTLAPETEGVIPFIEKCKNAGVVVSLGHHNGNDEQVEKAADAGATLCTHLGNGCANLIDRHNNPIWPQLSDDRLNITIIVDGFHLTRQEVRTFYKVKGIDHTILVSDALDLAGMPPGEYIRGERKVLLTPDVVKFPEENVLAGAATPISTCVTNIMKFTGCSLGEAIKMGSTNPAHAVGLNNVGELEPGKRADLILFSLENGKLIIQETIVAGKVVYKKK